MLQAEALKLALAESDPWAWNDAIEEASALGASGWAAPIRRSLKELAARDKA